MTHPDQPEQSGRAVILILALALLVTLGTAVAVTALVLRNETPARPSSSLGAGDSGPGGPHLPHPPARAAT